MQRITLVCLLLSLFGFGINQSFAESLPSLGPKLTPIDIPPDPVVRHATYYEPSANTKYSPLTMAASVPVSSVTPASCCSPAAVVSAPAGTLCEPGGTLCAPPLSNCCPQVTSSSPAPLLYGPATRNARGRVVTCRPVMEAAPMPRSYYVGRGMIGQPVVYVPGQPVRNALRWFFP